MATVMHGRRKGQSRGNCHDLRVPAHLSFEMISRIKSFSASEALLPHLHIQTTFLLIALCLLSKAQVQLRHSVIKLFLGTLFPMAQMFVCPYTPTLRYRGCYVTDVFAYLVISSVLRSLVVFYIRDRTTQT